MSDNDDAANNDDSSLSAYSNNNDAANNDDNDDDNIPSTAATRRQQRKRFGKRQHQYSWMNHRCIPIMIEKAKHQRLCCYKNCPGYDRKIKQPAPFRTIYQCEECSLDHACDDGDKNGNMWFCYGEKNTGGNKFFYDGKISQKFKDAPWFSF